ncbi:sigma 54-interacting transcriptional regulator [Caloramator sp. Dgby_cultured_2]|uniref:sigma 54-interacting transcriptional regulator n=1 Tax=Caloramator sp. Dgby_cultured_2 TaxID=3029174 RepID=UPI00237EE249|nr:sigma 54-interacting transcriptional regulator [Caloramator sp. Dgby_cultured_2]WDU84327.1 sigma 54-interacting transcriptional regulator [Caloramator sp. Dgby_cultured_2]
MPLSLQAKLLRVLQESYVRRIGGLKDIPIDVRVIATTNEDPYTAILNGKFRKDLYYRLSVINITIPPLRERKEDIALFVKYFIKNTIKNLIKMFMMFQRKFMMPLCPTIGLAMLENLKII